MKQASPSLRPLALAVAVAAAPLVSTYTMAQDAKPVFEEVLVTAEKRSESLQDLSQAVTAFSSEDLDQRDRSARLTRRRRLPRPHPRMLPQHPLLRGPRLPPLQPLEQVLPAVMP